MNITFLGAAETVTGSKYLLEHENTKILVDCGLFQGLKELRLKNWYHLPCDPKTIDMVLLTHAHIDHSGYLPLLVKNGFKGTIFCSKATYDLCQILLPDSGFLHEEDAKRANKYHYSKHNPALPLYTEQDAIHCLKYFKTIDFDTPIQVSPKIYVTWRHAGHILGAAFLEFTHENKTICFSGDLGRPNDPIMLNPDTPHVCQTLVVESTYGDRLHGDENPLEVISQAINQTIKQHGTVLIPAFAVGRTQSIIYYLDKLLLEKKIPNIPIYLDSPMAIDATKILLKYFKEHRLNQQDCARICSRVQYIQTRDESKYIDQLTTPKIIISASGMMTGGRILHHIKKFAPDARNTILLTGFQAAGTRGARLLNNETVLKIHGEMVPIHAKVVSLSSTSAHADYQEILDWIEKFPTLPQQIFITHGEPNANMALKKHIKQRFNLDAIIPKYLNTFKLF